MQFAIVKIRGSNPPQCIPGTPLLEADNQFDAMKQANAYYRDHPDLVEVGIESVGAWQVNPAAKAPMLTFRLDQNPRDRQSL